MREIKLRARFKRLSNRAECWQILHITKSFVQSMDVSGFTQITDWEQFTGLKDKNGKDIYEGDLIENKWGRICQVI